LEFQAALYDVMCLWGGRQEAVPIDVERREHFFKTLGELRCWSSAAGS